MADQPPPQPPVAPAEGLSRSYGELLSHPDWELDVGEADSGGAGLPSELPTAPPPLARIVEALLFVGGAPLTADRVAQTIRGLTPEQLTQTIDTLNQEYRRQGRPYVIQVQEQGYVLALRPTFRPIVEKLYGTAREARLSAAAIDVLALVAYRQPACKQEIDSLRGADSGALLRQLVRRGLITVVHRGEAAHREVAYGTTARFLKMFALSSVDDLPQTQDLQRL
jgi:segregation and condensation protein B